MLHNLAGMTSQRDGSVVGNLRHVFTKFGDGSNIRSSPCREKDFFYPYAIVQTDEERESRWR